MIAVFDADFIPPPDFLERAVGAFADPRVGMVQARWGHANRRYSLLTRLQALLLDGHFVLEHGGRHRGGCFFNFNGAAGIWRRAAIESAGGWQHDTLTEDLDLSYRAQLAGWRFVFLPDVVAPAELPVEMSAFKSQQHRWAKGSIQTCRKVLPAVLRADVPWRVKAEAFLHLTANFNYLLVLALCVLIVPASRRPHRDGRGAGAASRRRGRVRARGSVDRHVLRREPARGRGALVGTPAGPAGHGRPRSRALRQQRGGGRRGVVGTHRESSGAPRSTGCARRRDPIVGGGRRRGERLQPLIEIAFGAYFTLAVGYAVAAGVYGVVPVLVLFQAGFLYAGFASRAPRYETGPAGDGPAGGGAQ